MSKPQDHDDVDPGRGRSRRGTAAAATALAVLLLTGLGLSPAAATATVTADRQGAHGPASAGADGLDARAAERLAGVARELAEAVTHGEITQEQAVAFLQQLRRRLGAAAEGAGAAA
ncbi:hypothetical protein MRU69_15425 [Kocuria flava]|uniref:hypothetical protein n=1 Tax=Kocuria flava TaxID=446860 RepID=UPI001FF0F082|nr:hypothetical protein [Kocuria flava]MCJ8506230.1 hypothetical protein [Kocuria flava]